MWLLLLLGACSAFYPDVSNPEQYATVLTWDQWVPTLSVASPFAGILFLTVTPIIIAPTNLSLNTYRIDAILHHNIDYATDASVWGVDPRGAVLGSIRLFFLYQSPAGPTSASCPLITSTVVDEDVVVALRQGQLFGVVSSSGIDGGELRGQIETRNDIYYAPLVDPTFPGVNDTFPDSNVSAPDVVISGAAIIRIFDIPQGDASLLGLDAVLSLPVGIDFYILSMSGMGLIFIGQSVDSNATAYDFGTMPSNVAGMDLLYQKATYLIRRDYIETVVPPFGFNSSNLKLFTQDFDLVTGNVTTVHVADFYRLPLLAFSDGGRGNNVFVFNLTGTDSPISFGGGGGPPPTPPSGAVRIETGVWIWFLMGCVVVVYELLF